MARFGLWIQIGIYLLYTLIYFGGSDGASDYFWVNNDFFFIPLLVTSFVLTLLVVASGVAEYRRAAEQDQRVGMFRPAAISLLLAVLFAPFAFMLAFVDYAAS